MIRPAAIAPSFVPERAPEVAWVELDGEVVTYHDETTVTVVLNATASLLWQLIDGRSSLAEIACELADEYQAPADSIEHDLVAVARQLGTGGLLAGVHRAPEDAAP